MKPPVAAAEKASPSANSINGNYGSGFGIDYRQDKVFGEAAPAVRDYRVGADFIDLYALLGVAASSSRRVLEEAIIGAGAECICFALARRGRPARLQAVEAHLADFRLILLDAELRRRYDALLAIHHSAEAEAEADATVFNAIGAVDAHVAGAESYADFVRRAQPPAPPERGWRARVARFLGDGL